MLVDFAAFRLDRTDLPVSIVQRLRAAGGSSTATVGQGRRRGDDQETLACVVRCRDAPAMKKSSVAPVSISRSARQNGGANGSEIHSVVAPDIARSTRLLAAPPVSRPAGSHGDSEPLGAVRTPDSPNGRRSDDQYRGGARKARWQPRALEMNELKTRHNAAIASSVDGRPGDRLCCPVSR